MHTRHLVATLSLLITPAVTLAQTASDSTPRPGAWAAEVFVRDGGTGGSLLRFLSSRNALVMGLDANVMNVDTDGPGTSSVEGTTSNFGLRLGMRTYRQSGTEQLRPVFGFGARGGYSDGGSGFTSWTAGAYGELGAVYFLTPHVSLGATGELEASFGKRTQTVGSGVKLEQKMAGVSGTLIRVMLGVSF